MSIKFANALIGGRSGSFARYLHNVEEPFDVSVIQYKVSDQFDLNGVIKFQRHNPFRKVPGSINSQVEPRSSDVYNNPVFPWTGGVAIIPPMTGSGNFIYTFPFTLGGG